MTTRLYKKNPAYLAVKTALLGLPAPKSLNTIWNIGSILSFCFLTQILTGILLASSYNSSMSISFILVNYIIENLDNGWLVRYIHANGASLFFICIYLHIGRGLYYSSYRIKNTWIRGVTLFILTITTAFLGYVLPLNQISFWGASVITNLFSEVPFIGKQLILILWGNPSIDDPTITRFYTFHFLIPFIILIIILTHITYLHTTGSSNTLGIPSSLNKLVFHPYFSTKDIISTIMIVAGFAFFFFYKPLFLGDNENFIKADPSLTPNHIQPEWYFLFAYAILRSIPNKLGGIIALIISIIILYLLPFITKTPKKKGLSYNPFIKLYFWCFCVNFCLLSWIGTQPVENPYITLRQIITRFYFLYFLTFPFLIKT